MTENLEEEGYLFKYWGGGGASMLITLQYNISVKIDILTHTF